MRRDEAWIRNRLPLRLSPVAFGVGGLVLWSIVFGLATLTVLYGSLSFDQTLFILSLAVATGLGPVAFLMSIPTSVRVGTSGVLIRTFLGGKIGIPWNRLQTVRRLRIGARDVVQYRTVVRGRVLGKLFKGGFSRDFYVSEEISTFIDERSHTWVNDS